MRHNKAFRKFGRSPAHRRAMFRNMTTSLLEKERVETTVAKAKDLRRVVEKIITLGAEDTLHRRRQAYGYITKKDVVHKLFTEIGPRFKERPGGYTRITRTRTRTGDAAEMAVIELVEEDFKPKQKKKRSKKAAAPKKAAAKKEAKSEEAVEAAEEEKPEEASEEAAPAEEAVEAPTEEEKE